jgi:hypothetical protein
MDIKTNDIKPAVEQDASKDGLMLWAILSIPLWIILIVLACIGNSKLYQAKQRCTESTTADIVSVNEYEALMSTGIYSEVVTVTKYRVTYYFITNDNEMVYFTVNYDTDSNYTKSFDILYNPDNSSEYFWGNDNNMKYSLADYQ